jgi:drug/metabolite transporter (DMT)-like permease
MAEFFTAHIGELAALITSVLWASTSTFFTLGGRMVGSVVVNRLRLLLAIGFLLMAHLVLHQPLPTEISTDRLFWLSLSGVIGLALGDAFLFQGFVMVGPRLSMLMMSLAPVIATLLAWLFLGEQLTVWQICGILLTIGGIAWVVTDGNGKGVNQIDRRIFLLGILFALGGATGQAVGLVTAKQGMYGDFPALSATLIRMLAAAFVLWLITIFRRQVAPTFRKLSENKGAFRYILAGSIVGPFLGVTFSLVAIQNTEVGIASTLMALPPVLLLPISYFVFGERYRWRAVVGTFVAISGVALLFLV